MTWNIASLISFETIFSSFFLDWQGSYTNITAGISTAYSDIDTTDNVQDVRST